eukprot:NODE_264_length_11354_cov_1.067170.p6 type:complete len:244 gc:universal NODE_264_length_11354_cov_1.067170:531-1262(+)
MELNFEPYYDAIHRPFFAVENAVLAILPFKMNVPFLSKSEHSKHMPFMSVEIPIIFLTLYCCISYWGTKRTTRFDHPFFKVAVNVYNASLVALSAFMVLTILIETTRLNYSWFNNGIDESKRALPLAKALSIFYLSKFPELLDTVIMAIKGNTRQISFLHVYHHTSIIIFWYCIMYSTPYSEAYFTAFQNSFIHTLMYSYYLMTSLKIGTYFTKKLKKYMTQMQMVSISYIGSIRHELLSNLL